MNRILGYLKNFVSGIFINVWVFIVATVFSSIIIFFIHEYINSDITPPYFSGAPITAGLIVITGLIIVTIPLYYHRYTRKIKYNKEKYLDLYGDLHLPRSKTKYRDYIEHTRNNSETGSAILLFFAIILGILAIPSLIAYWYFNPIILSKRLVKIVVFTVSLISLTINYFLNREKYETLGDKIAYFSSSIAPPSAVDIFM